MRRIACMIVGHRWVPVASNGIVMHGTLPMERFAEAHAGPADAHACQRCGQVTHPSTDGEQDGDTR